jgi:putative spermidine/putrescine transport system ATP-binding protein
MRDAASTQSIRLVDLAKDFGSVRAVDGVSLEIADGEFFSMLGPSGSGKTTVLRLVAGFEQPTRGRIELAGKDVTGEPPHRRDVNTVFQDYALFPHMSVIENVEYGLRVKKVPRTERRRRSAEALETVRLGGHAARRPHQLSGGQRQRVALARALVNRPKVLLLDEPLGALDLKLRREMQIELKQIQRDVGITFVFVTHDQEEALTMGDRIAVFRDGRVEQVGTPVELYERPATSFTAGFVGTSNLLTGELAQRLLGRSGSFGIRPEKIRLAAADQQTEQGHGSARGVVREVVYLGAATHAIVELDGGGTLTVQQQNLEPTADQMLAFRGERVVLSWQPASVVTLAEDPPTEQPDAPPTKEYA